MITATTVTSIRVKLECDMVIGATEGVGTTVNGTLPADEEPLPDGLGEGEGFEFVSTKETL